MKKNRHHLIPKCRVRKLTKSERNCLGNILNINIDKHSAWHKLFGILTLDEVIELLQRLKRFKDV